MTDKIVPFGKYKGRPIEVLAQDRPYLEWLSAQSWFRERFARIYTLIINNFGEASETPDHNALQVLFLEDAFCARFVTLLIPQWPDNRVQHLSNDISRERQRIIRARASSRLCSELAELDEAIGKLSVFRWKTVFAKAFEENGVDVQLRCQIWTVEETLPCLNSYGRLSNKHYGADDNFRVEIKPSVGDDYPAVLRQMRANRSNILFTERYTGTGATEEQFVKTFALSEIKVVFRREVDATPVGDLCGVLTLK